MKKEVIFAFLYAVALNTYGQTGGVNCLAAVNLVCGQTISGTTLGVPSDGLNTGNFEGTDGQLWYVFTSLGNGTAEVSLCDNNTNFDTRVHVYTGSCGNLNFLAEDDDACVNPVFASDLIFPVTTGETYYIRIGGSFNNAGNFVGNFDCSISILGCTDALSCNYSAVANTDDGSCEYNSCYGCTYQTATNYNANATFDDGSCIFSLIPAGCLDPNACNYCNVCTVNSNSCEYSCLGCTYPAAANYNPSATRDNGSCQYAGCTNPQGYNFNPLATVDNGTCDLIGTCFGDMNQDGIITIDDVLLFIQIYGTNCN
jgi:hypothetical protein